jgi:fatty acid desaturase
MPFLSIRKRVLESDPGILLQEKFPIQLGVGALWIVVAAGIAYANTRYELSIPLRVLSSLGIGLSLSILTFFNHELLHGSIVRSPRLAHLLAYPGFFVFALSPEIWKAWHNQLHHFNTNRTGGLDPDLAGDWNRLKNRKIGPTLVKLLPGSGHPASYLFNTIVFTAQCANVTWLRSREAPELYRSMNRTRAYAETLAYYAIWLALLFVLPFGQSLFLLIIPAAIVNVVVFNYVGLPHNMRPLAHRNDPLATTLSLESPSIVNRLFFHFSLHSEHHIFPEANHSYLPRVREILRREFPNEYRSIPHGRAIRLFYSTPRAYFDDTHLFYPETGREIDLLALAKNGFELP